MDFRFTWEKFEQMKGHPMPNLLVDSLVAGGKGDKEGAWNLVLESYAAYAEETGELKDGVLHYPRNISLIAHATA